ncbi:MAG: hypothetical protein ABIP53_10790 [Candidatus Limnocylindrales bacterium]
MTGFEMFCERCGTRYGSEESTTVEALPLTRRLLIAVGVAESPPPPPIDEPLLSFCLACRGYSCPSCWNDSAGFCQTCVPLPEPEFVAETEFVREPEIAAEPEPEAEPMVLLLANEAETEPEQQLAAEVELAEEAPLGAVAEAESEALFVAEAAADVVIEAEAVAHAEIEALTEVAVEAGVEMAGAIEVAPEPVAVSLESELEVEPPLPEFTYDEIVFVESDPEPEVHFDWALDEDQPVAAEDEAPAEPVHVAEPEPVIEHVAPMPEIAPLPVLPLPILPPPVFRPLEPMGRFVPPPRPAPLQVPRMEFDLPEVPPAFLVARRPDAASARPVLPASLFEGPGPAIRPCSTCDLPVSARARFCRRCGSSQS